MLQRIPSKKSVNFFGIRSRQAFRFPTKDAKCGRSGGDGLQRAEAYLRMYSARHNRSYFLYASLASYAFAISAENKP